MFTACSEEDENSDSTPSLTATVVDDSDNAISGASVSLYASQDDAESLHNVLDRKETGGSGFAVFNGLKENQTYYINITYSNSIQTFFYKVESGKNECTFKFKILGTIFLRNYSSDTYKFTVTGDGKTTPYTIFAGSSKTISGCTPGYYNVDILQLDGYSFYATTDSQSGTLQTNSSLTFSID
jgi:hypothetical protein